MPVFEKLRFRKGRAQTGDRSGIFLLDAAAFFGIILYDLYYFV
jgi:hypothetical protein